MMLAKQYESIECHGNVHLEWLKYYGMVVTIGHTGQDTHIGGK